MNKVKVLFVCIHNSARSQMAEAFLAARAGDIFDAHSAGLEPGKLNPIVVASMKEVGIDISKNKTKSVFDFYKKGEIFQYVITVCDAAAAQHCPVFPSVRKTIQWSIPDPSALKGSRDERLQKTGEIRDMIRNKVEEFVKHVLGDL